jgi:hypothetical protein
MKIKRIILIAVVTLGLAALALAVAVPEVLGDDAQKVFGNVGTSAGY